MAVLTVTAKGQVTLRKDFLRHLGVGPGDKINAEPRPNGRLEITAAKRGGDIREVFGALRREGGPRLSIEEITAITEEAWAGRR